jgi:hypothetical protein
MIRSTVGVTFTAGSYHVASTVLIAAQEWTEKVSDSLFPVIQTVISSGAAS